MNKRKLTSVFGGLALLITGVSCTPADREAEAVPEPEEMPGTGESSPALEEACRNLKKAQACQDWGGDETFSIIANQSGEEGCFISNSASPQDDDRTGRFIEREPSEPRFDITAGNVCAYETWRQIQRRLSQFQIDPEKGDCSQLFSRFVSRPKSCDVPDRDKSGPFDNLYEADPQAFKLAHALYTVKGGLKL